MAHGPRETTNTASESCFSSVATPNYQRLFDLSIQALKDEGRYRLFQEHRRQVGAFPRSLAVTSRGERLVTVWCSNDYLSMGEHPNVRVAMRHAVDMHGAGAGGTRNISGNHSPIVALEKELAALHGKGAALVFSCGYLANLATLATLGRLLPNCVDFRRIEPRIHDPGNLGEPGGETHIPPQ